MSVDFFLKTDFEYLTEQDTTAVCGDCLKVMKYIPDGAVDLIFADPPYNLGKDFGNDSDRWKNRGKFLAWCRTWLDECMRILKPDGTAYFMNSTQNMPYLDIYCQEKYHVLSRIIWAYDSSGVQSKRNFGSLYEPILMVAHDSKSNTTFNSSSIMVEAKTGAKRNLIDYRKNPPARYSSTKVPGNVWEIPRVRFRMKEYVKHPSQKPEALLERIILASSNPREIVLDPFAGTFTTCAVAHRLGRKTIGIEMNRDYFLAGLQRLGIGDVVNRER